MTKNERTREQNDEVKTEPGGEMTDNEADLATQNIYDPPVMTRILLMRHPQTQGNVENRYQGQSDSALSRAGEAQLARAVEGLTAWKPDVLISSPLGRCLAIAEPVGENINLEVETDDRLQEIAFGLLEGLDYNEAKSLGLSFAWEVGVYQQPVQGAESMSQFAERVVSAASEIASRKGRVAVVTHGGVIRVLLCCWMKIPYEQFWSINVANVESACFSVDEQDTIYFDGFGIQPEWLASLSA